MTPRLFFHKARYWIYFRFQLHRALPALWRAQLSARYALIDRHRRKKPFIILAAMRTGTNYLISMLHSAGISCRGEILGNMGNKHMLAQKTYADPRGTAIHHLRRSIYTQGGAVVGAKIFMWQLEAYGLMPSDIETALPGCRYLILYRASLVDQYYSYVIAYKTNVWQLKHPRGYKDPGPIRIERDKFASFCDRIRRAYTLYLESPEVRRAAIIIKYEDLKAAPQDVFDRAIFPHLGVGSRPVRSSIEPAPHLPKEEGIVNYADVRDLWTDPQYRLDIDPRTLRVS